MKDLLYTISPCGKYRISYHGTAYHIDTPIDLLEALEEAYHTSTRIRVTYGDISNGKVWQDERPFTCTIGRSTGVLKIPLVIKTSRSLGGEGLLDHCIVKLEYKRSGGYYSVYDITIKS